MPSFPVHRVLSESTWQAAAQAHEARLRPVLDPYLKARSEGAKNPVMDFLFEYYNFRPARLLRWSPGLGTTLTGDSAKVFLSQPEFARKDDGIRLDPDRFPERRRRSLRWIDSVLAATERRKPFFGCQGMHEWAMVYQADEVRHSQVPLRMSQGDLDAFVASRPIVCTHFDAFRFFTPEARPLNHHQPTHETMPSLEQPGCLHTNMDLYRWAYKLSPWVPSDLLVDTFLLAFRIREVDMRASPYDLRSAGLDPIPIETSEGRVTYQRYQQHFHEEAMPLRARLRTVYNVLIAYFEEHEPPYDFASPLHREDQEMT